MKVQLSQKVHSWRHLPSILKLWFSSFMLGYHLDKKVAPTAVYIHNM